MSNLLFAILTLGASTFSDKYSQTSSSHNNMWEKAQYDQFPMVEKFDYQKLQSWFIHPFSKKRAKLIPQNKYKSDYGKYKADVFFVHPSTPILKDSFHGDGKHYRTQLFLNNIVLKYQISAFNHFSNIYAPHYRQAHNKKLKLNPYDNSSKKAINLAYSDVKNAFMYFLKIRKNKNGPFFIAGSGQGSKHLARLILEMQYHPDMNYMVSAYLPGANIDIKTSRKFNKIRTCSHKDQINCIHSWNFKTDSNYKKLVCNNPFDWNKKCTKSKLSLPNSNTKKHLSNLEILIHNAQCLKNGILKVHFKNTFCKINKNNSYQVFFGAIKEDSKNRLSKYHTLRLKS